MNKVALINNISMNTGYDKTVCEKVIDSMVYEITESLVRGERVAIQKFMNFDLGERAERNARNPSTGEIQKFPAVKTIKCKMCKEIKNALNNKQGDN